MTKCAACIAKRFEIIEVFDSWNARKLLGKVVYESLAVIRRMQQAIDVVEQIYL